MDLAQIMRVIRARWYVMLPAMLITIVATAGTFEVTPVSYQSQATIALLDTTVAAGTSGTTTGENPFLSFSSSLVATADYLARSLSSDAAAQELAAKGVTETYTAALATNAQGPFVTLTLTGSNSAHVLQSTNILVDYAGTKLQEMQLQSSVPKKNLIQMAVIVPPQAPQKLQKKKLEMVILVAAAGTVLSFMLAFLVENLAQARRRARHRRSEPAPEAPITVLRTGDETAVLTLPEFDDPKFDDPSRHGRSREGTINLEVPLSTHRGPDRW